VLTPLLSERTRGVRGASAVLPVVLGAAALLAAATPAGAQNATSSLRGVVTNQAGAPVSDAQVQVRNVASGVRRGALTNASGFYNVGGLQPGAYEVRVLRIGFTPTTTAVRLTVGEVTTRDFRIGEAAVQLGTVVATAQRSTDRSTSEVAATISTEQIENLPQNNRNFIDFAALAPGVQRRGSGISSGGVSENNANLFIDGASYKSDLLPGGIVGQDRGLGGRNLRGVGQVSGNPFPQSAVQEFRVVTQNYKAEYQRASGAVVTAATKAGTNDVTGDLFFYGQNRNLLATSYYDRADRIARPEYARGQFGGSVGGPIVRDRAHFFGSYEATYVDLNTRVAFRPPPALASQLPDSLLRGQGQYATPLRSNLFFGKADYTINDRQGLIFTANVRRDKDSRGASGNAGSEGLNNVRTGIDNYLLRHTYTAGAVTNEAQAGYQRQDVSNRGVGTGAQFVYDVYNVTRGAFPSIQQFRQDKYTIRDDLSYALGSHVFKGGAITEFLRYDLDKRNSELPVFVFRPLGQGNPAGFGVGVPTTAALEIGNGIVRENNTQFGAYLQDDWTIARRLTLNLGLRWDVETNALNNSFRTPQVVRDSITRFLQTNPFFDGERYFNDGPRTAAGSTARCSRASASRTTCAPTAARSCSAARGGSTTASSPTSCSTSGCAPSGRATTSSSAAPATRPRPTPWSSRRRSSRPARSRPSWRRARRTAPRRSSCPTTCGRRAPTRRTWACATRWAPTSSSSPARSSTAPTASATCGGSARSGRAPTSARSGRSPASAPSSAPPTRGAPGTARCSSRRAARSPSRRAGAGT
jgi:hypothetical protein